MSMRFSRQGYWNGLPFPSAGDLPNPGIKPKSPELQADSLPTELQGKPILDGLSLFNNSGASLFCELFPLLLKTVPMSHSKKTNKLVSMRSESVKEYVLTRTTDFLLKKKEKKKAGVKTQICGAL